MDCLVKHIIRLNIESNKLMGKLEETVGQLLGRVPKNAFFRNFRRNETSLKKTPVTALNPSYAKGYLTAALLANSGHSPPPRLLSGHNPNIVHNSCVEMSTI